MPLPDRSRPPLALFLSASTLAVWTFLPAGAQTRWIKEPAVRFQPDDSWGPYRALKGGPRLVRDDARNLYVNLGDSLLVGAAEGTSWRVAGRRPKDPIPRAVPLAEGEHGTVIWGDALSRDQGHTWTAFGPDPAGTAPATAYAVLENGTLIAGGGGDRLGRSVDSGKTWAGVHSGRTYGSISALLPGGRDWAFAAPGTGELLASRDSGKTWVAAVTLARGKSPDGIVAKYMGCNPANHMLFALTDPSTQDPVLEEIRWVDDSILITSHQATRTFPDSQISAFAMPSHAYYNPLLLVGTWGQGVWASTDWGKSWSPRNEGLGDLHIEALAIQPSGTLHVLTLDGLYTQSRLSSLAPALPRSADRVRVRLSGPGLLFGAGAEPFGASGRLFRADGRHAPGKAFP